MRILLDESVPGRVGSLPTGHSAITVQRRGWTSIKNGKLLALAAGEFDVLLTADKGMEYQQNLATLPVSILIVLARSNRVQDLEVIACKTWRPQYRPSCLPSLNSRQMRCGKLLLNSSTKTDACGASCLRR